MGADPMVIFETVSQLHGGNLQGLHRRRHVEIGLKGDRISRGGFHVFGQTVRQYDSTTVRVYIKIQNIQKLQNYKLYNNYKV